MTLLDDYIDLLYIIACAVNEQTPDINLVKKMNLCKLYRLAVYHMLVSASYYGLESSGVLSDNEWMDSCSSEEQSVLQKWRENKDKAIRKNLLLGAERYKLFDYCEKEHIWYMPLKGSVMEKIYPKNGMRQMADNDILFDAEYQEKIKGYFENLGYEVAYYAKGNHDVYKKKPVYNFEMHTALFGKGHLTELVSYYDNVKDRLIADKADGYGYHFSIEDFYIYMLAHTYKHYNGSGTGLRSLLDVYVYQKKYGDMWNRAYLEEELAKLSIMEFEKDILKLAKTIFGNDRPLDLDALSKENIDMLSFFVGAGTYGNIRINIEKKLRMLQPDEEPISRWTKVMYIIRRAFPAAEWIKVQYPICERLPWLIPLCVVHRIIFRGTKNLKYRVIEINTVKKSGNRK